MNGDYFDRLEAQLAGLTRAGTHLDTVQEGNRRPARALLRRGTIMLLLAVVLAASLVSEFPGSASGRATAPRTPVVRSF